MRHQGRPASWPPALGLLCNVVDLDLLSNKAPRSEGLSSKRKEISRPQYEESKNLKAISPRIGALPDGGVRTKKMHHVEFYHLDLAKELKGPN